MGWLTIVAVAGEREAEGCRIVTQATQADGVTPMVATCRWPEVDPARLAAKVSDFAGYDLLLPHAIVADRVVRVEGDRSLVWQHQTAPVIADREVLLWMRRAAEGACTVVSWTAATEVAWDVADGRIRAPRNDGSWRVCPAAEGGVEAVHTIAYDPGGQVPGFVVRAAQGGGLDKVLSSARAVGAQP